MNVSLAKSSLLFDILVYGCITTGQHVLNLGICLTFELHVYVCDGGILSDFYSVFILLSLIDLYSAIFCDCS